MNNLYLLIIRQMLGMFFAAIIMRIFRPDARPIYIVSFGALLVGLAYGLEHIRKKR
jgi:hypothetical protein